MHKHTRKMIAPIIIAALIILYYIFVARLLLLVPMPSFARFLLIVVPLALAGGMVYVLWERIKEIRSGEEDDLSKY